MDNIKFGKFIRESRKSKPSGTDAGRKDRGSKDRQKGSGTGRGGHAVTVQRGGGRKKPDGEGQGAVGGLCLRHSLSGLCGDQLSDPAGEQAG